MGQIVDLGSRRRGLYLYSFWSNIMFKIEKFVMDEMISAIINQPSCEKFYSEAYLEKIVPCDVHRIYTDAGLARPFLIGKECCCVNKTYHIALLKKKSCS